MTEISVKIAYEAAFIFIREYYIRDGGNSQDIESLLSSMIPGPSGRSSDPAMREFFEDAVGQALKEESSPL
ncbi:hypothetical protein [Brevundimonas sp.]|uniref:hypothetical protein n=1 Tax=Brevundimonas sp. TaxID=1871086 RepID=UPI003D0F4AA7